MLTTIIRVLIIYLVVLVLYRIMGKRQLGQMQPFELVLTLIIADLATIPMAEVSVPVLHGIIPLLTLTLIHFVLTLLSKLSRKFSNFLSGKPVIVINPNGIDCKALKNLNLSVDDIFEAIRGCGYFNIEQIQYAIMETNGKMTVLPKGQFTPLTASTVGVECEESFIPINIINEGKINKENLQVAKLSEVDLQKILQQANIKKVKDVLVLTIDKGGSVFVQKFGEKYKVLKVLALGKVRE